MPRPKAVTPPRSLNVHLPPDLMTRLDLYLISPVTGKIPQGSYQRFFAQRLQEFFDQMSKNLGEMK